MIEEDADKVVGKRIQTLRERRGLLQGELSGQIRAAGVNWSQGTLSKVEMGTRPVRLAEAPIVAATLGVEVTELLPEFNFLHTDLAKFRWSEQIARAAVEDSKLQLMDARWFRQCVQLLVELTQGGVGPYVVPMSAARFLSESQDGPYQGDFWHTAEEIIRAVGIEQQAIDEGKERARQALRSWRSSGADKAQFEALLSVDQRAEAAPNWIAGYPGSEEEWNETIGSGAFNDLLCEEFGRILAVRFPQVEFRLSGGGERGEIMGLDEPGEDS